MIKLDVAEYCQSCLDFTPDVIKPVRIPADDFGDESIMTDTIVQCKYNRRCAGIKRYLEQQAKNASN